MERTTGAQSIETFVLVFSNPEWQQDSQELARLNASISFHVSEDSNIRTLSTNTADNGDIIEGLLYVPDLDDSDPCRNISRRHVADNSTRQANLPTTDYSLIALAPWISANCTLSYLAAARADPARAFIFYSIDNSTNQPPPVNDPIWGLNDGGMWKSQNKYPVYAVPGQTGALMMHHLGKYSGNMTDVENGHLLTEMYDSRDYVRLYTEIATANPASLPSLWVFLLIILGILLMIIGVTSLLMHYIQRKHRQALRRRVANGEVDLEALGIKRLTVPQEVVDKMPLFIYVASDGETSRPGSPSPKPIKVSRETPETNIEGGSNSSDPTLLSPPISCPNHFGTPSPAPPSSSTLTSSTSDYATTTLPTPQPPTSDSHSTTTAGPLPSKLPHRQLPYSQPSCPICLDDFISHETIVRELICGHIFHPECVDTFLRDSSSLCPMCKKSVLPKGYCPANVTNAMVRRERLLRRMRERVTVEVIANDIATTTPQRPVVAGRRMASFHRQFGRAARANARRTSSAPMPSTVEMTQSSNGTPVGMTSRRDWARRRASAMLGSQRTLEDEERAREARIPKWRKAIGTVFPGFR